jgi:hypothetical protein
MRGAGIAVGIKVSEGTILMTMNHASSQEPGVAAVEKKPYEKPAFRCEQVFVTSALSCSKNGTEGNCSGLTSKVS